MRIRVGAGDTLQTTALVHEAYLKLRSTRGWNDEGHFLRASALAMRHALINHALARQAGKRGGGSPHVPLDEALDAVCPPTTRCWPSTRRSSAWRDIHCAWHNSAWHGELIPEEHWRLLVELERELGPCPEDVFRG
jgi:hypothetical protein